MQEFVDNYINNNNRQEEAEEVLLTEGPEIIELWYLVLLLRTR